MGALTFRSLKVRRMPGIIDGGFTLETLAGGVNVVFGPNASGKTSTARTVESLLWPSAAAPREAWLEGLFRVDGEDWWVEVDAGRSKWQREGADVSGPALAPPEDRDRYSLSLQELLRADDAGFARSIMLESAGGYDLNAAARILAPKLSLSRPRREIEELRAAKQRLIAARAVQESLYQQSLTLEPDETRLAQKPMLEARRALLELLLEHNARQEEAGTLRERLDRFHPVVGRLNGNEADLVAALRKSLAEAEGAARRAEFEMQRLARELEALALPAAALERERLAALHSGAAELEIIHREMRAEERRAAEQKTRLDSEQRRLGASINHRQLRQVGGEDVEELSSVTRALLELRSERASNEAELRLLGPTVSTADRGKLDRGAFLLQQWLRLSPPPSEKQKERRLVDAAGLLLVVAGMGFSLLHLAALAVVVAGVVVLFLARRRSRTADPRAPVEAEFTSLGLNDPPAGWEAEEVRRVLDQLSDQVAILRAEESRNERRQRFSSALSEVAAKEEALQERIGAIRDRTGIDAGHDEFRLAWTVEAIGRWQKAEDELTAAFEARDRAWEQESDVLARANQQLLEVGIEPATTAQLLRARIDELQARVQQYQEISSKVATGGVATELARQRTTEIEAQLEELFSRLEITPAEEARLKAWCGERSAFVELEAEHRAVTTELERLRARVAEGADDPESLLATSRQAVEEELAALAGALADLADLSVRVIQLKRDIENAKRGHDIEDALAEVERATSALRSVRTRDINSAIAHALVTHVERTSRDQHLPEVFHRASSIFARITHGRYTLRIDDTGTGAFRAWDTTSERSHALEELSSATRLQLLLAVRVAFIELQERGLRLPILMDETLANSDDDRAGAIMDAVLELADNGRQIFYFTAQPDEVRKWSAAMARRPSLEGRVIDLGAVRKLERRLPPEALQFVEEPTSKYPSPGFLTHSAYASLLHVPPVDVFAPVGSLHLWYLIEDPETLHRVLETLRAECWGQLDALADYGGAKLLGQRLFSSVRTAAEAAGVALARLAVGRGQRVDRQTLVESGAVTDRFLDEVASLAAELNGDGEKLLVALGTRAVPGFRAVSIEALNAYLEDRGYIDTREPLGPELIRLEVMGSISSRLHSGELTLADLDRLLNRIFAGAGVPPLTGSVTVPFPKSPGLPSAVEQIVEVEQEVNDAAVEQEAGSAGLQQGPEATAVELSTSEASGEAAGAARELPVTLATPQLGEDAIGADAPTVDGPPPPQPLLAELLPTTNEENAAAALENESPAVPRADRRRAPGTVSPAPSRKREPIDNSHELKLL